MRAKILMSVSTWSRLAPDVEFGVFVRAEAGVERDWVTQPAVVATRSSRGGVVGRLIQRELLSIDVARWRPDLVYLRYGTVSPSLIALSSWIPTVIEMNTLDLAELRLRSPSRYLLALTTRALLLRRARGIVVVAEEIGRHESVRRFGRPMVTVPNSIAVSEYAVLPPPNNRSPRVVFIGAPRLPWHGIDKIVRLARRLPAWSFDVVGPDPSEIVDQPPNLRVHGLMSRSEYEPILAQADVALGPLALHRKEMSEASPLKVAEYLAYGLPVIVGYADTRFPRGAEFLLEIANSEDNIDASLERIQDFVAHWKGKRVDRGEIASIDADVIERRRLEFMLRSIDAAVRR